MTQIKRIWNWITRKPTALTPVETRAVATKQPTEPAKTPFVDLLKINGITVRKRDNCLTWAGGMMIDADGSGGNKHKDKYYQSDTTLHHNGRALNAETLPFIVVPPQVILSVGALVMGCRAVVSFQGIQIEAVVGDCGPPTKIGEASIECARRLGIPSSPINGGLEQKDPRDVTYTIYPGVPAVVDGVVYKLQPATQTARAVLRRFKVAFP